MTESAAQPRDFTFPHAEHVQRQRDFERAYAEGVRVRTRDVILYARPNDLPTCRGATVASRRVGNAVARNRAKRVLREAWRLNKHLVARPCDVVLVASQEWRDVRLGAIEPAVRMLIEKANAQLRR